MERLAIHDGPVLRDQRIVSPTRATLDEGGASDTSRRVHAEPTRQSSRRGVEPRRQATDDADEPLNQLIMESAKAPAPATSVAKAADDEPSWIREAMGDK